MPCGVDAHGMPFGLQVVGRFRGDAELMSISAALEEGFEASDAMRRPIPDLANLPEPVPALRSIVTAPPLTGEAATSTPVASAAV